MAKRRRRYTPEQKAEAVRLVRELGYPPVVVAKRLRIPLTNVSRWVLDELRAPALNQRSAPRRRILMGTAERRRE